MDFDENVSATETAGEVDQKKKTAVIMAISLSFLASRGTNPEAKANELYDLFNDFLGATGYTVVKKEI